MPAVADVEYGEIVVRHNAEAPQLLIKVDESTFVPFIASGQISSAIESAVQSIDNDITTVSGHVVTLKSDVSALSAAVETTYATKQDAQDKADAAQLAAEIASSAYTKEVSGNIETALIALSGNAEIAIEAMEQSLGGRITSVENEIDAVSATVKSTYWTAEDGKAYADAVSGAAKAYADAVSAAAKSYVEEREKAVSGALVSYVNTKVETIEGNITAVSGNVIAVSGAVKTLSGNVVSYVDTKLSAVYKYKGTVATCADLPANPENGDVYNVTAASGSTPAGSNYAWSESESKWDALGGTVDLSTYATKAYVDAVSATAKSLIETTDGKAVAAQGTADIVSGAVNTLSGKVVSDYATKVYADTADGVASAASVSAAKSYTDTREAAVSGALVTYVDSKSQASDGRITNLENSASTYWNKALQSAALGTVSEASSTQSGAKMSYTAGGAATLDLSELVIDCGSF